MPGDIAARLRVNPWNLLRCLFSSRLRREMVAWRQLVLAARGDETAAERLVGYELERQPWLFLAEAIDEARERLVRDRDG
jgi:hypothetical protein